MIFGERLKEARLDAGLSQGELAKLAGVKQGTVAEAEAIGKSSTKVLEYAKATKVNPEWLATGKGKKHTPSSIREKSDTSNVKTINNVLNVVPKISWVQAGGLCDAEDHYEPGIADEWLICPVKHGKRTYVLEVVGDSMNSGDLDGYLEGFDIFVDPDVNAKHGDDVIVRTPENKATFKRLQVTDEGKFLLALNKTWPNRIISVPENTTICGVVIYSGKSRKK